MHEWIAIGRTLLQFLVRFEFRICAKGVQAAGMFDRVSGNGFRSFFLTRKLESKPNVSRITDELTSNVHMPIFVRMNSRTSRCEMTRTGLKRRESLPRASARTVSSRRQRTRDAGCRRSST